MTAPSRLTRLLALVPWLGANDGVSLDEAAAQFGVSVEQLEADLWLLIVCGLPGYGPADLVDIQFWDDGRIHVLDPQTLARPLRLTADEATALLLGLRVLQQVPGAAPTDALDRAVGKLEAGLQTRDADAAVVEVTQPDDRVASALQQALASDGALTIAYGSATSDVVTERVIQPLRLVSIDGRSSLVAYCTLAEGVRTFRVDRILAAAPCDRIAVPEQAMAASSPAPGLAVDLLLDRATRWIAEAHGGTVLEEDEEGGIRVRMPVHDLGWLARLVLGAGPGARVLAPAEAVAAVRAAGTAALSAYAGP